MTTRKDGNKIHAQAFLRRVNGCIKYEIMTNAVAEQDLNLMWVRYILRGPLVAEQEAKIIKNGNF